MAEMKHVPELSKDKAGYELHGTKQAKNIFRLFLDSAKGENGFGLKMAKG